MCPSHEIDTQNDAGRVFQVLQGGGIAIIPASVGYGIVAIEPDALRRIFVAKRRSPLKKHAMIGSYTLQREIHHLPAREQSMVRTLAVDLDLPIGVVAPYRSEHPMIQKLPPQTLAQSTMTGTLAMLVNGGPLQERLSQLAAAAELPLMGSSANLTGAGTKTVVEDIEPEVKEIADIIIDYGQVKFSQPRPSSTMIDFVHLRALRYGACYDVVQDVFQRFYNVILPSDPGKEALFSGHVSGVEYDNAMKA